MRSTELIHENHVRFSVYIPVCLLAMEHDRRSSPLKRLQPINIIAFMGLFLFRKKPPSVTHARAKL